MAISKNTSKVDFEVTKTFELLDPEKNGTGVMVTVKSDRCEAAKDAQRKIVAAGVSLEFAQRKGEDDAAVVRWLEKQEELQLDRIFACTVSIDWNGEEWNEGDGGLELTRENLAIMLNEEWVAIQFAEAIREVGDFTKK